MQGRRTSAQGPKRAVLGPSRRSCGGPQSKTSRHRDIETALPWMARSASGQRIRASKRWLSCSDSVQEALVVSCAFWRLSMNACPEAQAGGANRADSALSCRSGAGLRPGQEGLECRAQSWTSPSLVVSLFGINSWAANPRGTLARRLTQWTQTSNQTKAGRHWPYRGGGGVFHVPCLTFHFPLPICPLSLDMDSGRGKGAAVRPRRGKTKERKTVGPERDMERKKRKGCVLGRGVEVKASTG